MSKFGDNDKIVKVSTLLQKVIYQKKWQKRIEIHNVFHLWNDIVGGEIASHAQPDVIHGDILWVEVTDSVWMQQLQFMKHELIGRINKQLSPAEIKDIRFRQGYRRFQKKGKLKMPAKVVPDPEKKKEFDHLVDVLENEDTRKALQKLWLAFASHEKVK